MQISLVLFSFLTSKHLIYQCKFNLCLREYKRTLCQLLPTAVNADKTLPWSISNDCFHQSKATFLNWDCRMAQMWLRCDKRYTLVSEILLSNKAFEGLTKLDKLQGYYTFQEVKEYCCRWLGMSLVLSALDVSELVAQLPCTWFHLIRSSLFKASTTSKSCANLFLNNNIVFLREKKNHSSQMC